ncbi:MAG: hypothetical protein MR418_06100 [Clostridiales bacterium]|nr:hypothetical protein [Clostridiales bacterium]MDY4200766.1 hypothetical protein [Candidatus Fimadaptatus sp.]
MKRSFKVVALVVCLVMAMFAFAACGNNGGTTATTAPETATTAPETATDAPAAATDEPAAATDEPAAATDAPAEGETATEAPAVG